MADRKVLYVQLTDAQDAAIDAKAEALGLSRSALAIRAIEAYEAPASESTRIDELTTRIEALEAQITRIESTYLYR